jgi:hypothetical protein
LGSIVIGWGWAGFLLIGRDLFFAGLIIPATQDKRHHGDEDTQQDLCTHDYSPVEGAFQSAAAERATESRLLRL